jgi:hypothetical protein
MHQVIRRESRYELSSECRVPHPVNGLLRRLLVVMELIGCCGLGVGARAQHQHQHQVVPGRDAPVVNVAVVRGLAVPIAVSEEASPPFARVSTAAAQLQITVDVGRLIRVSGGGGGNSTEPSEPWYPPEKSGSAEGLPSVTRNERPDEKAARPEDKASTGALSNPVPRKDTGRVAPSGHAQ